MYFLDLDDKKVFFLHMKSFLMRMHFYLNFLKPTDAFECPLSFHEQAVEYPLSFHEQALEIADCTVVY